MGHGKIGAVAVVVLVAAACLNAAGGQAPKNAAPTYSHDILPILKSRCIVCHGAASIGNLTFSGGLALDSYEATIKGVGGAKPHTVIEAGKSGSSSLMKRLMATSPSAMMPRGGPPLAPAQIDLFRRWIDAGAPAGAGGTVHLAAAPSADSAAMPADAAARDVVLTTHVKPTADMIPKDTAKDAALDFALKVGPLASVGALAYSPDGKVLAVGEFRSVILWDTVTGVPTAAITHLAGPVLSLSFRPDGAQLAVAGGAPGSAGEVKVYDTRTWSQVGPDLAGDTDMVNSVAWNTKGSQIVTGSQDKTARLWDWPTGKEIRQFKDHADAVTAAAFSPDDKSVYTACQDHNVRQFETATGKLVRQYAGHTDAVMTLAVRPDGQRIVSSGTEPTLRWFNTADGAATNNNGGHGGPVNAIVFSKDGKLAASASADGTARIWDAGSTGQQRALTGAPDWLFAVAISPDDKFTAAAGADGVVRIWETATGRLRLSLLGWPPSAKSPDTLWAAITPEGYYNACPAWAARLRITIAGHGVALKPAALTKILFRPDNVGKGWQGAALDTAVLPAAAAPATIPAVSTVKKPAPPGPKP